MQNYDNISDRFGDAAKFIAEKVSSNISVSVDRTWQNGVLPH